MLLQLLLIPLLLVLLKLLLQVLLLLLLILLLLVLLILLPILLLLELLMLLPQALLLQVLLLLLARSSVPPSAPLVPSPAHAPIVTTGHPTFAAVNQGLRIRPSLLRSLFRFIPSNDLVNRPTRLLQQFLRTSADVGAPQTS